MTRLTTLCALAFGIVIGSLAPALVAQTPAAKAAVEKAAPALDEADALVIQVVQLAAMRANDACATLDTTKAAQSLQKQAVDRFAKKYPAFDVDFAKGALVAKAAAK